MPVRNGERGAAAVEFAMVVPLLLLLIMGIVEFGRAYHVQTTVSGAARQGVRVMALSNDPAAAKAAVKSAASPLELSDAQITVSPMCPSTGTTPQNATVTVTYNVDFLTGMLGSGVTVTGKGVMRCNG